MKYVLISLSLLTMNVYSLVKHGIKKSPVVTASVVVPIAPTPVVIKIPPISVKKTLTLQEQRWHDAVVRTSKQSEVRWTARQIERNKDRYVALEKKTNVSWWVIASLHNMECSLNFGEHLHNGDPLTSRTRQVPAGRPKTGNPPFTFEQSAEDALHYDKMDLVNWKNLDKSLNALEGYNGWGYKTYHPTVPTPYLWGGTNLYVAGKYVQDSKWSSTAVSTQIGICAILKELRIEF